MDPMGLSHVIMVFIRCIERPLTTRLHFVELLDASPSFSTLPWTRLEVSVRVCVWSGHLCLDEGTVLLMRLARKLREESGDSRYRARIEDERPKLRELIYVSCTRPICESLHTP